MPSRPRRLLFVGLLAAALAWRLVSPGNQPPGPQAVQAARSAPSATTATLPRAIATEAEAVDPLAAFEAWLRTTPRDPAEGERLARARRPVFQQLIATDPQAALARALAPEARATLSAGIAALVEEPVHGVGKLSVVATCALPGHPDHRHATHRTLQLGDRRYTLHAYGRALAFPSQEAFVASGIALGDELALAEPSESARPVIARSWTHGEKTLLWVRADFSDAPGSPASDAEILQSMAEVNTYFADVSHSQTSFRTTILPITLRLPRTRASYATAGDPARLETDALLAAVAYAVGQNKVADYDPSFFDRTIVITSAVPAFTFGGSGGIGTKGIYLNGSASAVTVAHELGHNHGLQHAHAWLPATASPIGPGSHIEYGDSFDIMGFLSAAPYAHFNTKSKADLHFLEPANLQEIETSGTYRLYRHDHRNASGVQALKIAAGNYEYWLEHRRLQNPAWSQYASRYQTGVQLRWGRYSPQTGPGTYLLDATPGTRDQSPDSPLTLGETFTDLPQGISISPLAAGGTAPLEWIDVRITYGALPGSGNRDPIVEASFPTTTVPARFHAAFRAVVNDPDGDVPTIRWDFGDGTPEQFGAAQNHAFPAGGTYRVRCVVTDGRGGRVTRYSTVVVDDPLRSWISLSRRDTQNSRLLHTGTELLRVGTVVEASNDGVAWTRRATLDSHFPIAVANSGTLCVSVGTLLPGAIRGSIQSSPDGVTWRAANLAPPPVLRSVAFGAGRFVAIGDGGAVLHSTDGVDWTYAPAVTPYNLRSIHFAVNRFVAVGDVGVIITSRDGLAWQATTLGSLLSHVVYFRGRWHAFSGNSVWTSTPEPQTWTEKRIPTLSPSLGIHAIGDEFLISRGTQNFIQFSVDGEEWSTTSFSEPLQNIYPSGLAVANDTIYLALSDGEIRRTQLHSSTASLAQPEMLPAPQYAPAGKNIYLATGPTLPGVTYQWYKDGQLIPGATGPTLGLAPAQAADSGRYHVTLTNFAGILSTPPVTVTIDPSTVRLINLSVRTHTGGTGDVFTLGFVVARSFYTRSSLTAKPVLVRAAGPALAPFGVVDALADPQINLVADDRNLASNNDWAASLRPTFEFVGAFAFPAGSKDAALSSNLAPRAYTLQVVAPGHLPGEVLAEIYDADPEVRAPLPFNEDPLRLINVSARGPVTAPRPLIGGFVLHGQGTRTILIRAVGPALASFGVAGALAAPSLRVLGGERILASNTGWSAADPALLRTTAARVGAFPLPEGSRDSALLVTLPAGAYTAQAGTADGAGGTVLLEVYEVP